MFILPFRITSSKDPPGHSAYNVSVRRSYFAYCSIATNGGCRLRRSIYLDNAATSYPKPEEVYLAMDHFAREVGGNPGRSGHRRSLEAGRELLRCRESLARLLGVGDSSRIILTRNATEALNLAIFSLIKPGGHILISALEHNSVWRPVHHACEATGAAYDIVHCAPDGRVDPEAVRRALKPNTSLLVFTHASNVLGTLLPSREISRIARSHGAVLLLDAAQTAGRYPLDVETDGLDLVAFSGHKELFGPPGTGGLYIAPELISSPSCAAVRGATPPRLNSRPSCPIATNRAPPTLGSRGATRGGGDSFWPKGVEAIRRRERSLPYNSWRVCASFPAPSSTARWTGRSGSGSSPSTCAAWPRPKRRPA